MGNIISADKLGDPSHLRMSNGSMTVLATALLLAGSDLAKSPWEIDLVRFLAERDQDVFGLGMVGFDLADIAWTRDGFAEQKCFLLEMIDLAQRRHRWETLSYDPAHGDAFAVRAPPRLHARGRLPHLSRRG